MTTAARKMPRQNPGRSVQDYSTPRPFLDAVERRFGPIRLDVAAHKENAVVTSYLGPGSYLCDDAFKTDWAQFSGVLWLNPPYADIEPWARKAAEDGERGARVVLLVPAAVGSNWFADHVHGKALVLAIRPRLSFDGLNPYPKDVICCAYGPWVAPGFTTWRWDR